MHRKIHITVLVLCSGNPNKLVFRLHLFYKLLGVIQVKVTWPISIMPSALLASKLPIFALDSNIKTRDSCKVDMT